MPIPSDGLAHWWQRAIIYQIYPRSFQDTTGNGVGDLEGIRQRLGHLETLGIDTIWLSPIYPSPMADFGYDVSDYGDIHPLFGKMADFDLLIADVHRRGMKLVLDYVPNHSSDQHPWFVQSRSSRRNPKRDWYIWRDPSADGGPPNNWRSHFGGIAWTLDEATGQYYLHSFLKEQPDLNWRNPQVKQAMFDVLRFWLGRGVDGFRVDVIWCLIKDDALRSNPPNPDWKPGMGSRDKLIPIYECDRPEMMGLVEDMRAVLDQYGDRLLIGEIYLPLKRLVAYYGRDLKGAQMPYNFLLIGAPWTAESLAKIITDYNEALPPGAWPNWVLSNHDKSRIGTRIGEAQARVAAMLLLTLRGTPTIYYGEEIGMLDTPIPPELIQDPSEKRQPGIGFGRDPERTPMPWDATRNAGFTTGTPWLPLGSDHTIRNVAGEAGDPGSMLALYRKLILLRRAHPALVAGTIEAIESSGPMLSYERVHAGERLKVILNMSHTPQPLPSGPGHLLVSTDTTRRAVQMSDGITMAADEGIVIDLAD